MKLKLIVLMLFCWSWVYAQNFKFPVIQNQGKSVKALVPSHWKVIDSVWGDLNNDKIEDLALIFEFYAAVKENRAYGDNTMELVTETQRPRILAIYFKSGRNYKLVKQNNNFILRSEEGGSMGDPLCHPQITDNKLTLSFEGGSSWRWVLNYTFKYQNKDWQLIAANNCSRQSGSGDMINKQYDFINKKRVITVGKTGNGDAANAISEEDMELKTLRTFSSFKKPWTWVLGPDEYL